MGLTSGLVDVEGLFQCLIGIHNGLANESILDRYSEIRRMKYQTLTDPMSSGNIRLLFESDPDTALQNSDILKAVVQGERDNDYAKKRLLVSSSSSPNPPLVLKRTENVHPTAHYDALH